MNKKSFLAPTVLEGLRVLNSRIIFFGLWLLICLWYFNLATGELGGSLGGDNAHYLMLAQSLAEGKGYKDLYLPGEPRHVKYPFVFPLLLSPLSFLKENMILASHILILLWGASFPLIFAGLVKEKTNSRSLSLVCFFSLALLPRYYSFLLNILTEIPFMVFSYLALWLLERCSKKATITTPEFIGLILSSMLAFFTRSFGITLLIAIFLSLLLSPLLRKKKILYLPLWLWYGFFSFGGILSWQLWGMLSGSRNESYFIQLILKDAYYPEYGFAGFWDYIERSWLRVKYYLPLIGGFFAGSGLNLPVWLQILLAIIGGGFIITGLVVQLKNSNISTELFFLFSLILVLVWYFLEQRFILPLLPIGIFYFYFGLLFFLRHLKISKKVQDGTWIGVWLFILGWQLVEDGILTLNFNKSSPSPEKPIYVNGYGIWDKPVIDWSKYEKGNSLDKEGKMYITNWLVLNHIAKEITPEDAVIASRKPTITWLLTQRKSARILLSGNYVQQWEYIKKNRVNYILFGLFQEENAMKFVKEFRKNFKLICYRSNAVLIEVVSYPE